MAEDIVHFVAQDLLYFAITASGQRLDIVRSSAIQPAITDEDAYDTYLWIETTTGFFVLKQRFQSGMAQGWTVIREIVPRERFGFFGDGLDWLRQRLANPFEQNQNLF